MKPIQIIEHYHIEGRRCGAVSFVTPNVQILVIRTTVRQSMDQPRISVKGKNDRLVGRKEQIEIPIANAVWMFARLLQSHQVDDIANRVEELVGVPARRQRPGLSFAIANHASDNQIRIVKCRSERM